MEPISHNLPISRIDILTLYFSVAIIAVFFSVAFFLFRLVDKRAKGTTEWGIGYFLIATALGISLFQPFEYMIGKTISALFLIIAVILLDRGIRPIEYARFYTYADVSLLLAFLFAGSGEMLFLKNPVIADRIHIGTLAFGVFRIAIHLIVYAKKSRHQIRITFYVTAGITGISSILFAFMEFFVTVIHPFGGTFEIHPIHIMVISTLMVFLIGAGMSKFLGHYLCIYKEAYEAANFDTLTGLRNRYYMTPELERNFDRAKRENQNLFCLMIDIDFFKKINDKYGHLIGDKVLKEIADRITKTVRNYDSVGRFGGEEFIIYEFAASTKSVKAIAQRIQDAIRTNPVEGISITASIGVARISSEDDSIDDLLNRTDEALYAAKRNGRNRIEVAKTRL